MAETPKEILERVREGLRVLSEGAQEPVVKVSAKMLLRDLDRLEQRIAYIDEDDGLVYPAPLFQQQRGDIPALLLTIKPEPDHE